MMKVKSTDFKINIGVKGLHNGIIEEIKRQLRERKVLKIKFMKVKNKKEFEEKVKELLTKIENVKIVKKIGHTIIISLLDKS